jgi:CheY-like chemotaxis protein
MNRKTILWADDDTDDLMLMKEILVKNGRDFDIIEVRNGKEALDHLDAARETSSLPCLIILDINMPVIDGKEALTLIKKDDVLKTIPVVIFTTSNSELDKLFCKRHQVEMITKPPHYKSLESAVLRLLEFCNI